jgi:hypothetical protein
LHSGGKRKLQKHLSALPESKFKIQISEKDSDKGSGPDKLCGRFNAARLTTEYSYSPLILDFRGR